jgi:branched-chain amino acid transport system permease protein
VAAGAFVVYLIQVQGLKQLNKLVDQVPILQDINFLDYQFLLFGVALVLMMLFRPEGLFPSQRRRRELHVAEELAGPVGDEVGEDLAEESGPAEGASIAGSLGPTPGADEDLGGPR